MIVITTATLAALKTRAQMRGNGTLFDALCELEQICTAKPGRLEVSRERAAELETQLEQSDRSAVAQALTTYLASLI